MQGRNHYGAPYKNKQVTYDIAVVEDGEGNTVLLHLKSSPDGKVVVVSKEIEKVS